MKNGLTKTSKNDNENRVRTGIANGKTIPPAAKATKRSCETIQKATGCIPEDNSGEANERSEILTDRNRKPDRGRSFHDYLLS